MAADRRQDTAEFKAKAVLQVLIGEKISSEICRPHKLNANMLKH
jgi:transposase-like protein